MDDFKGNFYRMPNNAETPNSQEAFSRAELQVKTLTLDLENAKISRYLANTTLRKTMSKWAAWLISIWLLIVATILMLNNFVFCLSDSVLNTLITTTTINVIGIILICFRDLFNGKSEQIIGQK